jgi:hypothetical protein
MRSLHPRITRHQRPLIVTVTFDIIGVMRDAHAMSLIRKGIAARRLGRMRRLRALIGQWPAIAADCVRKVEQWSAGDRASLQRGGECEGA